MNLNQLLLNNLIVSVVVTVSVSCSTNTQSLSNFECGSNGISIWFDRYSKFNIYILVNRGNLGILFKFLPTNALYANFTTLLTNDLKLYSAVQV